MLIAFFDRTDHDDLAAYRQHGTLLLCTRFTPRAKIAKADVIVTTFSRPPDTGAPIINLASTDTRHLSHVSKSKVLQTSQWNRHAVAEWTIERIWKARPKRVAVAGMGQIGRTVARALAKWGVDVMPVHRDDHHLPRGCDVLTLHARLTEENAGWADQFLPYLEDATVVNSARRGLLTDKALREALVRRWVRQAHLDGGGTFDDPRVVVTPHVAWRGERSLLLRPRRVLAALEQLRCGTKVKR